MSNYRFTLACGFIFLALCSEIKGQFLPSSPDCATAVLITDSIYGPTNGIGTIGKVNDLEYGQSGDFENNPSWFKFLVKKDTFLTFTIVPESFEDDYDFALFLYKENLCLDIRLNHTQGVRSCYSQNYEGKSHTGLRENAEGNFVSLGKGPAFANGIQVKKGQQYYLYVDLGRVYNKPGSGFTIYFYGLAPPEPEPVVLKNVLFETNKTTLLPASNKELDALFLQLKKNTKMKIAISGHTDNIGSEELNQKLSEGRAKAVHDYLISKGIDKNKLSYKGFGSQHPRASNSSIEGRAENRRVEFIIMK